jgi:hypothetical protein
MKTEFSPPYRIHQSIAAEWQVINSRGGYECAADSRRHAEELARELNSRRLLATTSEQDLIELGRSLREVPSDRAILAATTGLLLMVLFSVAAAIIALTSWIGG